MTTQQCEKRVQCFKAPRLTGSMNPSRHSATSPLCKLTSSSTSDRIFVARAVETMSSAIRKDVRFKGLPTHFHGSSTVSTVSTFGDMDSSMASDLTSSTTRLQSPVMRHWKSVDSCTVRGRNDSGSDRLEIEPVPERDYRRPNSINNTLVRPNEMAAPPSTACVRFDSLSSRMEADSVPQKDCQDTADKSSSFLTSRTSLNRLEAKIKKAACLELAYLNKTKEVQNKRKEWAQLYKIMTNLPGRANSTGNLHHSIEEVRRKAKASYLTEKAYLKKAKAVHDQRYRWTKIYEHSSRELEKRSRECYITELPPLLPPSFDRKHLSKLIF
jgi:hypothetical protein